LVAFISKKQMISNELRELRKQNRNENKHKTGAAE
jgi:hypothetical protein